MLLTLKPSLQNGFVNGGPHAYSSPAQSPSPNFPPPALSTALPPLPENPPRRMSTPHRGPLPPLTLPNPERSSSGASLPYGQLPQPPSQWIGQEDNMRTYLRAYEELQKRVQEEEKTKQEEAKVRSENMRLETSRSQQSIFHDAIRFGMFPNLVPIMFAGMAGPHALEIAQHLLSSRETQQEVQAQQGQHPSIQPYLQQSAAQQQQLQISPPGQQPQPSQSQGHQHAPQQSQQSQQSSQYQQQGRHLVSSVGPQPNPYGPGQLQNLPQGGPLPTSQPGAAFIPSYQPSSADRNRPQTLVAGPPPTSMPRPRGSSTSTMTSDLPRLNALEISSSHPTPVLPGQGIHQGPQQNPMSQQPSSSPTIFFHHWQPPNSQNPGQGQGQGQGQSQSRDPPTPSAKGSNDSPYSQTASSHLRSDYKESPKKRKATGQHQANQPPPSNLSDPSPPFSSTSSNAGRNQRREHSRQPSDTSQPGGMGDNRPRARTESGRGSLSEAECRSQRHQSAQPETRHPQRPAGPEMRTGSSTAFSGPTTSMHERNSPKREPEGPL